MSFPLVHLTISTEDLTVISQTLFSWWRLLQDNDLTYHGHTTLRSTMELGWICLLVSSLCYLLILSTLSFKFLYLYARSDFLGHLVQLESVQLFITIYLPVGFAFMPTEFQPFTMGILARWFWILILSSKELKSLPRSAYRLLIPMWLSASLTEKLTRELCFLTNGTNTSGVVAMVYMFVSHPNSQVEILTPRWRY